LELVCLHRALESLKGNLSTRILEDSPSGFEEEEPVPRETTMLGSAASGLKAIASRIAMEAGLLNARPPS
jgi:hypothetical protein